MPWCPQCKEEYKEGIIVCPDCKTPLVESLEQLKEEFVPVFSFDKKSKIVLIDIFFFVVVIFPDKRDILAGFGDGDLTYGFSVLVGSIAVKNKYSTGI